MFTSLWKHHGHLFLKCSAHSYVGEKLIYPSPTVSNLLYKYLDSLQKTYTFITMALGRKSMQVSSLVINNATEQLMNWWWFAWYRNLKKHVSTMLYITFAPLLYFNTWISEEWVQTWEKTHSKIKGQNYFYNLFFIIL